MKRLRPIASNGASARRRALRLGAGMALAMALPPVASQPAAAAPSARLRLRLERDARRLEVGEVIVVALEVWVTSWFQAPVEFPPTLAAEGALVEQVGGSPESRFEDDGGQRWTGLVRRYRVLPAQPGDLSVALPGPLQVQPGGGRGVPQRLAAPAPLRLTVRVPAGAEGIQPFVAARRLVLSQRWSLDNVPPAAPGRPAGSTLEAGPLQVGDLVQREVVLVTDSSSPLLPAPDFRTPAGALVRVHAAQTQEQRANAAATPTLTRRVQAVYTLQQSGRVVLPPIELVWWDLARRQRRTTRLEGRTLDVRPAAALADPFALPEPAAPPVSGREGPASVTGHATLVALLVGATLAAGAAMLRRRHTRAPAGGAAAPPRRNEAQAWRRLERACRRCDAPAADAALRAVFATVGADTQQRWLQDDALSAALTELGRQRFGAKPVLAADATRWHGQVLWRAASQLRRQAGRTGHGRTLPTLQP